MKNKRVTLYLSEENEAKFNEIMFHMNQQTEGGKIKVSPTLNQILDIFYRLFLEKHKKKTVSERMRELQKKQSEYQLSVLNDIKFLKNRQDHLLYILLAIWKSVRNPELKIEDLTNVTDSSDEEQVKLILKISELIKIDKENGQVTKHSHKKN